jgi:hypothetical protein
MNNLNFIKVLTEDFLLLNNIQVLDPHENEHVKIDLIARPTKGFKIPPER